MDRDVDERSTLLSHQAASVGAQVTFRIRVIDGPDKGKQLVLDRTSAPKLVGTSTSSDLRLQDPLVSRRHLSLDASSSLLTLVDTGSKNGTFIHGLRVQAVALAGGEAIVVGGSTLLVEAAAGPPLARLSRATNLGRVVGASLPMRRMYDLLTDLASSDLVVCIEGETGTGKELVAETLHELGPRAYAPFVIFDCAALGDRAESTLFGEEGPEGVRPGLFEQAHGGTLLIDEIAELDMDLQAKVCRTLERGELVRMGGTTWHTADVRTIASSRVNLDREVHDGRLREDLFHRLTGGRVALPPLRQREGDVSLLAAYFWKRLGLDAQAVPSRTLARWKAYEWPGNVRELLNAVERRAVLGDTEDMEQLDSRRATRQESTSGMIDRVLEMKLALPQARALVMEEFERRYVERVLAAEGHNVTRAAAVSGLARRYFQELRSRHRIP